MPYDELLADRVRDALTARPEVSERQMFGGIGFMVAGKMSVGVIGEELIVRLDPEDADKALAEDGVREFDFTGRPMKGWIYVAPDRTGDESELVGWVEAGADYAASLAPDQS
ncbi:MAG: TfoX/Sxy family protein [Solirubrobacterales bacterium]